MVKRRRAAVLAAALAVAALTGRPASSQDEPTDAQVRDLFRQGRVEMGVGAGFAATNVSTYFLLNAGVGYYVMDGLSLGASGDAWLGAQPEVYDASPYARYVFVGIPWKFKPYVGAFYRRTAFSSGYEPEDSAGGRAGFVFPISPRAYVTGGLAYEAFFNCNSNSYFACEQLYPEIGLIFAL